ncbi:hypothetical protein P9112_008810 [Eukaryota sp. TZLM1-RC]
MDSTLPTVRIPSREILKWLQSLDLSYPVRNVKRDFSNGFLVAEIFSRYFPQDVQLHSYENGHSSRRKQDNWSLLKRFFTKRQIPFNPSLINDTIDSKPDAALTLIEEFYSYLTKRPTPTSVAPPVASSMPSFTKTTLSTSLKSSPAAPMSSLKDMNKADEEITSPHRPRIEFKKVAVKKVRGSPKAERTERTSNRVVVDSNVVNKNIEEILIEVSRCASLEEIFSSMNQMPSSKLVSIFEGLIDRHDDVIDCLRSNGSDCLLFIRLLRTFLPLKCNDKLQSTFVSWITSLGQNYVDFVGPAVSFSFVLYYLVPLVFLNKTILEQKAEILSSILCNFTHSADLVNLVKELNHSEDQLGALSIISKLTTLLDNIDDNLSDVLLYLSLSHLSHINPKCRINSLVILTKLTNYSDISCLLPSLIPLLKDDNSQVRCRTCLLLSYIFNGKYSNSDEKKVIAGNLVNLINECSDNNRALFVYLYSICLMSSALNSDSEYFSILILFVEKLLSCTTSIRSSLIGLEQSFPAYSDLGDVTNFWNSLEVLRIVGKVVVKNKLLNLEVEHLDVIRTCLLSLRQDVEPEELLTALKPLKDFIFVSLCDPELVIHACLTVDVLEQVAPFVFLEFSTLLPACFKMLFPETNVKCHEPFLQLLSRIVERNEEFGDLVLGIVSKLGKEQLSNELLKEFVSKLGN